ncbi:hypothetical protein E4U41_002493 [Claviceps citrina]|nr:hypothetical protein E4U41_002493 [Claviceps citrina]
MPPRKRGRGHAAFTPSRARVGHDAMDVDSPAASEAGAISSRKRERPHCNDMWTDDQVASLFKGVIRWKPAGMHKHFRMIAISEHLRNHGFDPDVYKHTRIPNIWTKLRSYYDLDIIDEREYFDLDHDELDEKYVDFSLPRSDFLGSMMGRAVADASEAPTSPPELDLSAEAAQARKRKRAATTAPRARNADAEDTEDGEDAPAPAPAPAARPTRGGRGRRRGGAGHYQQVRVDKSDKTTEKNDTAETTEEEEDEEEAEEEDDDTEAEDDQEGGDEDEDGSRSADGNEDSHQEGAGTTASRSARRGSARKRAAPKPPARRTRSRR